MMQRFESLQRIYSLKWTLFISFLIKFSLFLVGVVIIGFDTTRLSLPACGSSSGVLPPVYSAPFGDLEGYTDYRDLYLRCLVTPFLNGHPAYHLPIVYNYPPLFLYTLSIFARLNYIWSAAIPLVAFDALTALPVYLIAKEFLFKGNTKLAFMVTLIWIANPINLFYNDLMWLNPGPTTFFLILCIYLFLKGRYVESSVALAVSTGFKQTSVLVFPIFIIAAWKTKGFSKDLCILYSGLLWACSSSYLFHTFTRIPSNTSGLCRLPILGNPPGAGSGYPTTFQYDLSQPVRLTTFLGLIKIVNLQNIAVENYPDTELRLCGVLRGARDKSHSDEKKAIVAGSSGLSSGRAIVVQQLLRERHLQLLLCRNHAARSPVFHLEKECRHLRGFQHTSSGDSEDCEPMDGSAIDYFPAISRYGE